MSKHVKHVPKHRDLPKHSGTPRKVLRSGLVFSSLAVAATGAAIGGGVAVNGQGISLSAATNNLGDVVGAPEAEAAATEPAPAAPVEERAELVSRSDRREAADPVKQAALTPAGGGAMTRTESLADEDPREIGRALLGEFGFGSDQFTCLESLWTKESNWRWNADNPSSSAYGIPQSLPGSKMASAGADWETNPVTQIRWGLGYIQDRYGSPCSAWGHSQSHNWY